MNGKNDFDTYWRDTFLTKARDAAPLTPEEDTVLRQAGTGPVQWTIDAVECVEQRHGSSAVQELLTRCACTYPEESLENLRTLYREQHSLPAVHAALQEQFLTFIRSYKQLDDEHMELIEKEGMGMAGKLDGTTITAVKIPKDFRNWYNSDDEGEQRVLYCHCPRVRNFMGTREGDRLPNDYCLCGAGFYRHLWEFILEKKVTVRVADSILSGGRRCKIVIDVGGE